MYGRGHETGTRGTRRLKEIDPDTKATFVAESILAQHLYLDATPWRRYGLESNLPQQGRVKAAMMRLQGR